MKNNKNNFKIPAKQPKGTVPLKDKKNEILAWILAVLMIFWTVASVFGFIGFARSCDKDNGVISASALTVDEIDYASYRLVKIPAGTKFSDETSYLPQLRRYLESTMLCGYIEFTSPQTLDNHYYNVAFTYDPYYLGLGDVMYCEPTADGMLTLLQDYYMSVYEPVNGYVQVVLEYTFLDPYDGTLQYYRGIARNVLVEFIDSVVDIQTNAWNEGYNYGLQKGLVEASDYSFFSLLSAVIDVPIQAFTSLFNFDLLGINLADFFYAIFTVCVILAVLRLIF